MEADSYFTIGEMAKRTGLPVKTIRFYSDSGIVPPTGRSAAGYRLYDAEAFARLDLVRTLRDLGLDLATIRRVLRREVSLSDIAQAHAEALDVQIRTLQLQRAVLRAVAKRSSTPQELELMNALAKYSAAERRQLINDFIDDTFGGLDANPDFVAMMRSAMPELPDDPEPEQVSAWVELAELVRDADFRRSVRRMAQYQAEQRADGDDTGLHKELSDAVRDKVSAAMAAGVDPASARARPVVDDLVSRYAQAFGRPDDADLRDWLLTRLEVANDPRAGRYWQLLATINGWPAQPDLGPTFAWLTEALRASA